MPEAEYAELIYHHPLATLMSSDNITLCPLIYDSAQHRLLGHLSSQNLFLNQTDRAIRILFTGVQGYISPNWYGKRADGSDNLQVPTWNYVSLEIEGVLRLLPKEQTLETLVKQSGVFEPRVNEDWTLDKLPVEQQRAMANAITAFEIDILNWQGKAKMSQNKSADMRAQLIKQMEQQDRAEYSSLVKTMKIGG